MKILFALPTQPDLQLEIQDTPDGCARFVQLLLGKALDERVPDRKETVATITASQDDLFGDDDETADAPEQLEPFQKPRTVRPRKPRNPSEDYVRTYRGKANRRGLVIDAMKNLHEEGHGEVSLDQIREHFQKCHPEEDTTHLDQVVRDLANKTEHVQRLARGKFSLTQSKEVATPD